MLAEHLADIKRHRAIMGTLLINHLYITTCVQVTEAEILKWKSKKFEGDQTRSIQVSRRAMYHTIYSSIHGYAHHRREIEGSVLCQ